MLTLEFKIEATSSQQQAIDKAIISFQFVRNKCLRYWMDNKKIHKFDLKKYSKALVKEFDFVAELDSQTCQVAAKQAWKDICKFFTNRKEYPKFLKNNYCVEYQASGWKLSKDKKFITFTDKKNIGCVKLLKSQKLDFYPVEQIKKVKLIKQAEGYYCQIVFDIVPTWSEPVMVGK